MNEFNTQSVELDTTGKCFDGILIDAYVHDLASGYVFGSSEHRDNCFIQTGRVVSINTFEEQDYVQTECGRSYLIGSLFGKEALITLANKRVQLNADNEANQPQQVAA